MSKKAQHSGCNPFFELGEQSLVEAKNQSAYLASRGSRANAHIGHPWALAEHALDGSTKAPSTAAKEADSATVCHNILT
ncbi:hypothetical protein Tdes44962_MAKER10091 [Teratosphaeria destructans]|uniref:Uncharacterized protein n=1 Tax=Teratosphaeria destructans TaxID=418781 RepID=A0A9W7W0T3_9PEZI|nr:hypothetical protein Tdes44962_MAKER10091 [Teratosphaeria destructans]